MGDSGELFGPDTMNAPWSLDSRLKLVSLACHFFDAKRLAEGPEVIGNRPADSERGTTPPSVADFLRFLGETNLFPKTPNAFRVARILEEMVSGEILMPLGSAKRSVPSLGNRYMHIPAADGQLQGSFRFARVLGPEFIHRLCTPGLVHISGTDDNDHVASGTGLVVDKSHIVTCRHVVSDMKVNEKQVIQGREYAVHGTSIRRHRTIDVAVLSIDGPPLSPIPSLQLQPPVVGQTVYTLGYPKLPGLRDASVTMQHGAVTNESVTSLAGERLFLYSAITRPGNSGGPVMSGEGYLLGLSVLDGIGAYNGDAFSPHYAGIPAQELVTAVRELDVAVQLPFVNYE